MNDKAKHTIPPTTLPAELLANPDAFLTGDLLGGGQLLPLKKYRVDQHGRKCVILVGPGDAIKIFATFDEEDGLIANSIEVNFPKLVHGHNGVALDEAGLLLALSRLEDYLTETFGSREVARSLIPGLSDGNNGDCHLTMIEICAHRSDHDGRLFRAFMNATHPCSPKRLVSENESVRFGSKRSKTAISIYLKKKEMEAKHGEDKVAGDDDVLRVEVILKGEHLVKEFRAINSPTVRIIEVDGEPKLVAFTWQDLVRVHQALMARFNGIFVDGPAATGKDKTDEVGRFIAQAFHRFASPDSSDIHEWIDLFGAVSGAAKDRLGRIRGACLQQIERCQLNTLTFADWFDDAAYSLQPAVWVPAKERVTLQVRQFPELSEAVVQAYGSEGFTPISSSFTPGGMI